MTKFKSALPDGWLPLEFRSGNEIEVTSVMVNKSTLKSIIEQVEQAAISKYKEKLAEQEPIAYLFDDEVFGNDSGTINDYIRQHGQPLYAHPCVSPVEDKQPCLSQNTKYETLADKVITTSQALMEFEEWFFNKRVEVARNFPVNSTDFALICDHFDARKDIMWESYRQALGV